MEYRILPPPEPVEPFARDATPRDELDPDPPFSTRRRWLLGVGAGLGGALAGAGGMAWAARGKQIADADWLDLALALADSELIVFASILEMKASNLGRDARADRLFARILAAAVDSPEVGADRAGALAVRALARAEHMQPIERVAARLGPNRPLIAEAIREALRLRAR